MKKITRNLWQFKETIFCYLKYSILQEDSHLNIDACISLRLFHALLQLVFFDQDE